MAYNAGPIVATVIGFLVFVTVFYIVYSCLRRRRLSQMPPPPPQIPPPQLIIVRYDPPARAPQQIPPDADLNYQQFAYPPQNNDQFNSSSTLDIRNRQGYPSSSSPIIPQYRPAYY